MAEKTVEPARQQEIRVIDRRSFTSDGDRRTPDATADDDAAGGSPPPGIPRHSPEGASSARREAVPSAQFQNLILNLARQAAAHLGADPSPLGGQVEIDVEAAHHIIDILDALRMKTHGNLTQDEEEMLEGLVGDLQMQFVAVRSRDPKTT